jgi:phosphomannomutase/phosphoglucomutase
VRLACPDEVKSKIVDFVRERYQQDYQVDTLDGARIHFAKGWAMVRQSNTQPVISMRFEAHTTDTLKAIQHEVQTFVEAQIKQYTDSLSL